MRDVRQEFSIMVELFKERFRALLYCGTAHSWILW